MTGSIQLPFPFTPKNEFTFQNFLEIPANAEVIHNCKNLPESNEKYCFLHGAEGSGKTHLLQAMNHQYEDSVYIPTALLLEYGPAVLNGFEHYQLVCIDDIDVLAGKADWEEKLFTLYNQIRQQGGHLLVAGKLPPQFLNFQLADLKSRLGWGLIYELQALSDPEKMLALKCRAESRGMPLGEDVLQFILHRSQRSMHELFSILDKMDELSLQQKRLITIPFIKQIMDW